MDLEERAFGQAHCSGWKNQKVLTMYKQLQEVCRVQF